MDRTRPTLNQLNIVSGNVDASIAFCRRPGVDIPDARVWRAASRAQPVRAIEPAAPEAAVLEDPDGIAVDLVSPISAEHRALPPAV